MQTRTVMHQAHTTRSYNARTGWPWQQKLKATTLMHDLYNVLHWTETSACTYERAWTDPKHECMYAHDIPHVATMPVTSHPLEEVDGWKPSPVLLHQHTCAPQSLLVMLNMQCCEPMHVGRAGTCCAHVCCTHAPCLCPGRRPVRTHHPCGRWVQGQCTQYADRMYAATQADTETQGAHQTEGGPYALSPHIV